MKKQFISTKLATAILAVTIFNTEYIGSAKAQKLGDGAQHNSMMAGMGMMNHAQIQKMYPHMQKMQQTMEQIQHEGNREKTTQLMEKHMMQMQQGMQIMMNDGMRPGKEMMGDPSMDIEKRMKSMGDHMNMMQMMMGQMMDHMRMIGQQYNHIK